jgi:hypothetical protein
MDMINNDTMPEDLAALTAQLERETAPAARELDAVSREKILDRASVEGWTPAQADWLDRFAKQPLFQAIADGTPGMEALEQAYALARRRLTTSYFEHALDSGKDRTTAFLTVIDLERQLAVRRGAPEPHYPDPVLLDACRAVEAAAQEGASDEDQIAAGFAVIRRLMEDRLN